MPNGNNQQLQQQQQLQQTIHVEQQVHQEHAQEQLQDQQLEQQHQEGYQHLNQPVDAMVQNMPAGAAVPQTAPPAQVRLSRIDQKKQDRLNRKVRMARNEAVLQEYDLYNQRDLLKKNGYGEEFVSVKDKTNLIKSQLEYFAAKRESELHKIAISKQENKDSAQKKVRWEAQNHMAEFYGAYARTLRPGSAIRAEAMKEKEKLEIKANQLKKEYMVSTKTGRERAREKRTISRHGFYDFMKGIFRRENHLSHEDAELQKDDKHLVNVGRAFMGGTKAMYYFKDEAHDNKSYLYKEATNCVGLSKPAGALVTEAASKLQQELMGDGNSIPAFAVRNAEGKVIGSMQEQVKVQEGGLNLFSWQASEHPRDEIPDEEKKQILQNHTLDWLLCNFDTKGENFLRRKDGNLVSFDKEASFYKIKDKEAATMSYTYKPHAADTLYNVMFRQYARGEMDLDLKALGKHIQKAVDIKDDTYIGYFKDVLKEKCGEEGSKKYTEMKDAILARKHNLVGDYETFFTKLVTERKAALYNSEDTAGLLNADGKFEFTKNAAGKLI